MSAGVARLVAGQQHVDRRELGRLPCAAHRPLLAENCGEAPREAGARTVVGVAGDTGDSGASRAAR